MRTVFFLENMPHIKADTYYSCLSYCCIFLRLGGKSLCPWENHRQGFNSRRAYEPHSRIL